MRRPRLVADARGWIRWRPPPAPSAPPAIPSVPRAPEHRAAPNAPGGAIAGVLDCGDCAARGWLQTLAGGLDEVLRPLRAHRQRYQACHEHPSTRRVGESGGKGRALAETEGVYREKEGRDVGRDDVRALGADHVAESATLGGLGGGAVPDLGAVTPLLSVRSTALALYIQAVLLIATPQAVNLGCAYHRL